MAVYSQIKNYRGKRLDSMLEPTGLSKEGSVSGSRRTDMDIEREAMSTAVAGGNPRLGAGILG